jgi:hypothetical protein
MNAEELRAACEKAGLEIREANDGAGTFLARPPGVRGPWFRCGPTHDTHPFLLDGIAERLVQLIRDQGLQGEYDVALTTIEWPICATALEQIEACMAVLPLRRDPRRHPEQVQRPDRGRTRRPERGRGPQDRG